MPRFSPSRTIASDQRAVARVAGEVADERAVDLDHVHRQRAQPAERGVARAEVVEREADAEPAQLLDEALGAAEIDERALGDLEDQAIRCHAGVGELAGDGLDQALPAQAGGARG